MLHTMHTSSTSLYATHAKLYLKLQHTLNNPPAILTCLSTMNTSIALGIQSKLKAYYTLVMFSKPLCITEGQHQCLQWESSDVGKAVYYKMAVLQS